MIRITIIIDAHIKASQIQEWNSINIAEIAFILQNAFPMLLDIKRNLYLC